MAESKCHICGKKLGGAFGFDSDYNQCRICGRPTCSKHIRDGVCVICREKLGEKVHKK